MRRPQRLLAVLVVCAGVAATPGWAAAADHNLYTESRPHCVVTAVEANHTGPVPAPRCFATFAEAIAAATGGRVALPANATTVDQETLDRPGTDGMETTSGAVIGIEYQHKYFGGWSYIIQSTNAQGCNGYTYIVPTLPSGRNNEISSARTYGNCKGAHYSGTWLTGSRYFCGCSQMGFMNDQTSSIFFSRTGYGP